MTSLKLGIRSFKIVFKMSEFGLRGEGGWLFKKCLNYLSGWVMPNWDNVPNFGSFLFDASPYIKLQVSIEYNCEI